MKIATNISISPIGGIARRVGEIQRKINKSDGCDQLVTIEINSLERSVVEDKYTKIYKIPLPNSIMLNTIYRELRSIDDLQRRFEPTIQEIEEILDKEKVNVILSEGTYYAPWCLYKASRRMGLPLVILYAGILKYETKHYPEDTKKIMIELEKQFIDPELMYLFPSNLTRSSVEKEYGKLRRVKIVPNGNKNPEYLLALKDELKRKKMDTDIYMISNINKKSNLRKKLSRARIKILSAMDTQQLRDFYRDMGVIVSPSFFETYGNVPIESVASGTPALINNNMGVAEIFKKHNLHNYITDFDDVQDVVSRIDEFKNHRVNKDIRESLRRYSWDSVIDTYFNVCRQEVERYE
jgi:glycosyltransferase involved in cell wall biosynthesis